MVCSAVPAFPLAIHDLLLQTLPAPCCCGCIPGAGGLHPQSQQSCAFLHFVVLCSPGFCSMLGGCPGSILLQLGQELGRRRCLEGVGVVCGCPLLLWLAVWWVYCLPCTGERAVLPCVGSGLWMLLPSCLRSGGAQQA